MCELQSTGLAPHAYHSVSFATAYIVTSSTTARKRAVVGTLVVKSFPDYPVCASNESLNALPSVSQFFRDTCVEYCRSRT